MSALLADTVRQTARLMGQPFETILATFVASGLCTKEQADEVMAEHLGDVIATLGRHGEWMS